MEHGETIPKKNKKTKKLKDIASMWIVKDGNMDVVFLLLVLLILVIGVMMMFSASYAYSYEHNNGDSLWFFKKQALFAVVGVILMLLTSKVNVEFYRKIAVPIMAVSIFLLILVLVHPYVIEGKEQFKRWLKLGIQFQPSEIAKLAVVIFMAWMILKYVNKIKAKPRLWIFLLMSVVACVCVLIFLENHLSCTILILLIGVAMTYMAGTDQKFFIVVTVLICVAAALVILNREALNEAGILDDYVYERLKAWLDADYDPQGQRWQINQSLYAIGSGGLFGLGVGNSRQKYLYLPEPQNDFVFSIVCEELGFIRTMGIIILFILLVIRGISIARHSKSAFGMLVTTGFVFQVGLQVALNIGVVTGVLPNTGISLPFFSYGGSSLVLLLFEMGIVLSVSRTSNIKKLI